MGKSITAFQSPERINLILEGYGLVRRTPKTITDRAALFAEYESIRERGYAFDRQESIEGGFCISAPIVLPGKPVVSAVSLSMPVVRERPDQEPVLISGVLDTARGIASVLEQ